MTRIGNLSKLSHVVVSLGAENPFLVHTGKLPIRLKNRIICLHQGANAEKIRLGPTRIQLSCVDRQRLETWVALKCIQEGNKMNFYPTVNKEIPIVGKRGGNRDLYRSVQWLHKGTCCEDNIYIFRLKHLSLYKYIY